MNLDRLCVHTITTKPLGLGEAIEAYGDAGVPGITVWRDHVAPVGAAEARRMLRESGLQVVSLCRGGFFPAESAQARTEAIEENRRAIGEAAAIGAPLVVLVCGAVPGLPLEVARDQIRAGIEAVLPDAQAAGVKLAVEPLHPMYADTRSAINTMAQANDLVETVGHPSLGIALDVYHTWWDGDLPREIARAGDRIFAFHVCDWMVPTKDFVTDRGLMGEGCIDVPRIRKLVTAAGFDGFAEVEVFSERWWAADQRAYLERIKEAFEDAV